ncbi:Ppx/GppA phosphatase family protein [Devriesea agamarum]|uniref:Ppx/GppA phosphatase family protein n=1 Tax=Devriesea agamarum TaxID=472569 RepID=UPI00071D05E8|nr:Ppx/GppA phosphatase family protein [Devriesea agamarum]
MVKSEGKHAVGAPVAAIDCGTNSIRLLIATARNTEGSDAAPADRGTSPRGLQDLARRMEIVRLGHGVDRTGRLDEQAIARTLDATRRYADLCTEHGVRKIRFVATSATRDADNRDDFVSGVRNILGVEPEVISGATEAALSFRGALSGLGSQVSAPYLVVDIGGGSTEFVLGTDEPTHRISVDMGCVRMAERYLRTDPPTPEEIQAAAADIEAVIDQAAEAVPFEQTRTLVGLAGSVTTVTAHALGLTRYEPAHIDGAVLQIPDALAACRDLLTSTREYRAGLGFMHPGRVDVIGAGALVWAKILERLSAQAGLSTVRTSEHDILDGIALSLFDREN